jgi:hypothetical protein
MGAAGDLWSSSPKAVGPVVDASTLITPFSVQINLAS